MDVLEFPLERLEFPLEMLEFSLDALEFLLATLEFLFGVTGLSILPEFTIPLLLAFCTR